MVEPQSNQFEPHWQGKYHIGESSHTRFEAVKRFEKIHCTLTFSLQVEKTANLVVVRTNNNDLT